MPVLKPILELARKIAQQQKNAGATVNPQSQTGPIQLLERNCPDIKEKIETIKIDRKAGKGASNIRTIATSKTQITGPKLPKEIIFELIQKESPNSTNSISQIHAVIRDENASGGIFKRSK